MSKQEVELERIYTVPLSRAWIAARHRRTRRAINILREFAEHHMKSSEIKIDTELNEELWKRGITSPPRRITVKMEKDEDGLVTISLPKKSKISAEPVASETTSFPSESEPAKETSTATVKPETQAPAAAPVAAEKPEPPAKKRKSSSATNRKKATKKAD